MPGSAPLQQMVTPRASTGLAQRLRNHLTEEREVAVGFRVRSLDDDLGRNGLGARMDEPVVPCTAGTTRVPERRDPDPLQGTERVLSRRTFPTAYNSRQIFR